MYGVVRSPTNGNPLPYFAVLIEGYFLSTLVNTVLGSNLSSYNLRLLGTNGSEDALKPVNMFIALENEYVQ